MKVAMSEYQGRCDVKGTAVGHAPKVLMDYYNIISEFSDVTVFAPRTILRSIERNVSKTARVFPAYIVMRGHNSFFKKIHNKLGMFRNIRLTLKYAKTDVIWFFNVEFYLMLYLAFCRKPKQKIVCTLFINGYEGGTIAKLKQKIFERAQKKMHIIIASGKGFFYKNAKCVYIPDYIYDESKFKEYKEVHKEGFAICAGTMNRDKQLDELIDAFNKSGYPLKIVGRFYDEKWLEDLKAKANSNITIENKYLEYSEYLELIAKATYCILPYSPEKYGIQTSGVLQESMFLGTVPVAHKRVLSASGAEGIGYEKIEELSTIDFNQDSSVYNEKINDIINKDYTVESVVAKYKEIFGDKEVI